MPQGTELAILYRRDLNRLSQEIAAFPDDGLLWKTVAGISNPAGNLTLHLEGNLREFIGRQLCGIPYNRDRPAEFASTDLPKADLIRRIGEISALIPTEIEKLTDDQIGAAFQSHLWKEPVPVRQFLIHLYGHLDWHLGQIDYLRRVLTGNGALELAGT
jgi:hypothetical protein